MAKQKHNPGFPYTIMLPWEVLRTLAEGAGSSLKTLHNVYVTEDVDQTPKCPSTFSLFSALHSLDIVFMCEFYVEIDRIPRGALKNLASLSLVACRPSLYAVLTRMEFVCARKS